MPDKQPPMYLWKNAEKRYRQIKSLVNELDRALMSHGLDGKVDSCAFCENQERIVNDKYDKLGIFKENICEGCEWGERFGDCGHLEWEDVKPNKWGNLEAAIDKVQEVVTDILVGIVSVINEKKREAGEVPEDDRECPPDDDLASEKCTDCSNLKYCIVAKERLNKE